MWFIFLLIGFIILIPLKLIFQDFLEFALAAFAIYVIFVMPFINFGRSRYILSSGLKKLKGDWVNVDRLYKVRKTNFMGWPNGIQGVVFDKESKNIGVASSKGSGVIPYSQIDDFALVWRGSGGQKRNFVVTINTLNDVFPVLSIPISGGCFFIPLL